MTLPASGAISMAQVAAELGIGAGGLNLNDGRVRTLAGVPSGAIGFGSLRGKSASPTSVTVTVSGATYTSHPVGGVAPYSYFWRRMSGAGSTFVNSGQSTQVAVITSAGGDTLGGTDAWRSEVTSATGGVAVSANFNVSWFYYVGGGGACFIADSMVFMADRTSKRIVDVRVGEYVTGVAGAPVRVSGLHRPQLGTRSLTMLDNARLVGSAEHPVWSKDPSTGLQWWATRDMQEWQREAANGSGPHFGGHQPFDLSDRHSDMWEYAHVDGWKQHKTVRVPAAPETQLYHLWIDGPQAYFVDGYLVSAMRDEDTLRWDSFNHAPI